MTVQKTAHCNATACFLCAFRIKWNYFLY